MSPLATIDSESPMMCALMLSCDNHRIKRNTLSRPRPMGEACRGSPFGLSAETLSSMLAHLLPVYRYMELFARQAQELSFWGPSRAAADLGEADWWMHVSTLKVQVNRSQLNRPTLLSLGHPILSLSVSKLVLCPNFLAYSFLPPERRILLTMWLHVWDNSLQRACFVVGVVGVAVAILATALRFVATKRSARKPDWEDWFAVLATIFYIFYVVPFLYSKFASICIAKPFYYNCW